jgi:hypothetical protein
LLRVSVLKEFWDEEEGEVNNLLWCFVNIPLVEGSRIGDTDGLVGHFTMWDVQKATGWRLLTDPAGNIIPEGWSSMKRVWCGKGGACLGSTNAVLHFPLNSYTYVHTHWNIHFFSGRCEAFQMFFMWVCNS